jgi:hypothetical protein
MALNLLSNIFYTSMFWGKKPKQTNKQTKLKGSLKNFNISIYREESVGL